MAESDTYDLVVIGGGPAGYAGAIRAGQLGKKVACIEVERAGGTCLNWGCIPSKALLKSAELYQKFRHGEEYGFSCSNLKFDFEKIIGRSRTVSDQMARGIEMLFKKNKVEYIVGHGCVNVPGMVEITTGEAKGRFLKTRNILLATGCRSRRIPGVEVDGERVLTSREALALKKQPKSMVVVGAGAIGVEFAYFYRAFGTEVTLVEMLPQVLPVEDNEVSRHLTRSFKKQGIQCHTSARVEDIDVLKSKVKMNLVTDDKKEPIEAESLLIAIGVTPNLEGAVSTKLKMEEEKGYLKVGDDYQTSAKGVYAAGDIIGPPWLAHVATWEAVQAVNGMFGQEKPKRINRVPGCTYCQPQVASVGLTEQAAKEKGIEYQVGKFPFTASGKAVASNEAEGFVKVISTKDHGEIIGVHILGAEATELIAEYVLAMDLEATIHDIHETIHAHPTLSEANMEAAASSLGLAIHI